MKFSIFIFLLLVLSCNSKKPIESQNNLTPEFTTIEFSESSHDFGKLKAGETVIFSFSIKNTGKNDLYISDLISDCGCLKARFNEKILKSGKTGYIEAEFNSSGLFGKQLKMIEIHSNTKEIKYLTIFAEVINEQIQIKY